MKLKVTFAALGLLSSFYGQAQKYGSTDDLWDVAKGTVVTSNSPSDSYFGKPYDPAAMFGAIPGGFELEPGFFVFNDGQPAGFVHFVEWRTAKPVLITSIKVHASGDAAPFANQREFARVVIKAKTAGSSSFNQTLVDFTPTHPYTLVDPAQFVVVNQSMPNVAAQEFRAEFTDRGVTSFNGPRILELDAFGSEIDPPHVGSTTDLWDVSRGSTVIAASEMDAYWDGRFYNASNIFGADIPGFPTEPGDVVFADGKPQGFKHFVEWRTQQPVTVKSFRLYAIGDGPQFDNQREFAEFRLLTKSPGSATFDKVLHFYQTTRPYTFLNRSEILLTEANIEPTTAQEFRAEFIASGTPALNGPRIMELDGFADELPLVARAFPAVEVTWTSVAGKFYQVQWKDALGDAWANLKTPIIGSGQLESVFDDTRNSGRRVYRIVELTAP